MSDDLTPEALITLTTPAGSTVSGQIQTVRRRDGGKVELWARIGAELVPLTVEPEGDSYRVVGDLPPLPEPPPRPDLERGLRLAHQNSTGHTTYGSITAQVRLLSACVLYLHHALRTVQASRR